MPIKPRPTSTTQIEGPFDSGEAIAEDNRFGDYARAHAGPEHRLSGDLPDQPIGNPSIPSDQNAVPWANLRTGRGD